jgi:hypothetical protein
VLSCTNRINQFCRPINQASDNAPITESSLRLPARNSSRTMRLILCTAIGASIGAKNLIPEEVDYTKIAIRVTVMNKV